jgi:hypothetical protein
LDQLLSRGDRQRLYRTGRGEKRQVKFNRIFNGHEEMNETMG